MERQIKFKAYWKNRIPQLGMCDVIDIDFREGKATISNGGIMVFPKLDEIELLQFTGLTDKNGKEMYENDILKSEEDLDKDCIYDDVTTYIKYSVVTKQNGYFTNDLANPFFLVMNPTHFEVVGNIYQNPELLKK
jgi:uncharacterized phage protein (TIGR01671 family)